MRPFTTTLLTGVALLATASPAAAGDVAASIDGDWRSRVGGVTQTITFDEANGQVFGDAGCNRFTGSFTVRGARLTISPLATTLMACGDAQMKAETSFLKRLQSATGFTQVGDTLTLTGGGTSLRLRAA